MSNLMTTIRCVCTEIWRTMRGNSSEHHSTRRRSSSVLERSGRKHHRKHCSESREHSHHPRRPASATPLTREAGFRSERHRARSKRHERCEQPHHSSETSRAHRAPSFGHKYHGCSSSETGEQLAGTFPKRGTCGSHYYEDPSPIYDTPDGASAECSRELAPIACCTRERPLSMSRITPEKHNLQQDICTLCGDIETQLSALEKSLESELRFYKQYISDAKSLLTSRASNIGSRAALFEDYSACAAVSGTSANNDE
ncbi:putative NF-kappaB inhibitor-like protein [Seal parapoxvirus]|uniref:Putative NF-kappaB inhibitor-like protein n=1 Tax=Seal parapoxvirus TaxID=187984 RepID=A0A1Z3GCQ2_9POXV|nr:putative NF-kappaB inhibitor-like protein [Seal parapoxvirus]ASC55529.1 putative NF-kappaB inhibitor-like protein [Seal parapoxvirus]